MKTDVTSSLTAALSGLQVGVNRARAASGEIAKLTTESDSVRDMVRPLLALQQAEQEVAVSTQIVKTDNETLGRFVDETA